MSRWGAQARHPTSLWYFKRKHFSILLCSGWAYESPLTLFYFLCRWVWNSKKLGVWLSLSVVVRYGWGSKPLQIVFHFHIHIICKQSVLAACYAVYGHMGPTLHCFIFCAGGEYGWALVMLNSHGWGSKPTQIAPHILTVYLMPYINQSGSAPCYAVDGQVHPYTGPCLCLCMWGWILQNLGYGRVML